MSQPRNAFVIQKDGKVHHFEPTFRKGCLDTPLVNLGVTQCTADNGLVLIAGQTVTLDALLSVIGILQDQAADMAQNELEAMP